MSRPELPRTYAAASGDPTQSDRSSNRTRRLDQWLLSGLLASQTQLSPDWRRPARATRRLSAWGSRQVRSAAKESDDESRQPLPNGVIVVLGLAVLLNYVDRGNLATAGPILQDELATFCVPVWRPPRFGVLLGVCACTAACRVASASLRRPHRSRWRCRAVVGRYCADRVCRRLRIDPVAAPAARSRRKRYVPGRAIDADPTHRRARARASEWLWDGRSKGSVRCWARYSADSQWRTSAGVRCSLRSDLSRCHGCGRGCASRACGRLMPQTTTLRSRSRISNHQPAGVLGSRPWALREQLQALLRNDVAAYVPR